LELRLFPGKVFARWAVRDRLKVAVRGVVRVVGFNVVSAALREEEIEALKRGLEQVLWAEPQSY
jgi:hypothetical protein